MCRSCAAAASVARRRCGRARRRWEEGTHKGEIITLGFAHYALFSLRDRGAWATFLRARLPDFAGAVEIAAMLMACVADGRAYVLRRYARLLGPACPPPDMWLFAQERRGERTAFYNLAGHAIVVCDDFLESTSRLDIAATTAVHGSDGSISFMGTVLDYFRLIGVEKAHHALYFRWRPGRAVELDRHDCPHDAHDHEISALRCKLRFAREQGLSWVKLYFALERARRARPARGTGTRHDPDTTTARPAPPWPPLQLVRRLDDPRQRQPSGTVPLVLMARAAHAVTPEPNDYGSRAHV